MGTIYALYFSYFQLKIINFSCVYISVKLKYLSTKKYVIVRINKMISVVKFHENFSKLLLSKIGYMGRIICIYNSDKFQIKFLFYQNLSEL